ncbi:MAG: VanZ family protein [Clostridia bacterium]|nr:VanZ family protein [Clostridia bacterium]
MKKKTVSIILWVLVVLWIGLIFFMSSQPAEISKNVSKGTLEKIYDISHNDKDISPQEYREKADDFIAINHKDIRQAAHFLLFFVLGLLVSCASLYSLNNLHKYFIPFAAAIIYPFIDESYQILIPGRAFEFNDILVDFQGMLGGCVLIFLVFGVTKLIKKK